jgi:two-component system osmolarity sensor histidine kinase EnvZ
MAMFSAPHLLGRLSLFWRTFLYLALLLAVSVLAWLQIFLAFEFQPQALQSARQVASMVNLTRAALEHADAIARVSLVKTLVDEEGLRIAPREPGDTHLPYATDRFTREIANELTERLGSGTVVARAVNGFDGLWVGFTMERESYWLLLDPQRVTAIRGRTWLIWLSTAVLLSMLGAVVIARLINRPLQQLSVAATRLREGTYAPNLLDEQVPTAEIRAMNQGFNRLARELTQLEQDRALMLAGISHDLRTPLSRLRLEAEMSVPDHQARADMVADMVQIDGIVAKFLDYARPGQGTSEPTDVSALLASAMQALSQDQGLRITAHIAPKLMAMADPVDLLRVINNLLENARRYGQTPGFSHADVTLTAMRQGDGAQARIFVAVADNGPGVNADTLARMTQPFFRGDEARSQASGAGLGLAVVEKMLQRMGGTLLLQSPVPNIPGVLTQQANTAAAPRSGLQASFSLMALKPSTSASPA